MARPGIRIENETYLALEVVAEWYELDLGWVRQVYDLQLVGQGVEVGADVAIAASMLDRLAEVRRLYLQTGLDLEDVALLLAAAGELP